MLARHTASHTGKFTPDPVRVTALSAALLINATLVLLLLRPIDWSEFRLPLVPERQMVVDLIPRLTVPLPPPPTPLPVKPLTTPAQIHTPAPVVPLIEPKPIDSTTLLIADPIDLTSTDTIVTDGPVLSTGNVQATVDYKFAPPPPYPAVALRRGVEGTVWLRVEIDEAGRPQNVSVERSSGDRSLDSAARTQVLKRWRFKPASLDGTAVRGIALVPVVFKIGQY